MTRVGCFVLLLASGLFGSACLSPAYDIDSSLDDPAPSLAGSTSGGSAGSGAAPAGDGLDDIDPCSGEGDPESLTERVSPAIVLFDSVVVHDPEMSKVISEWQFADGAAIADTDSDPRPGGKWTRTAFFGDESKVSRLPGAHCTFLACDGEPSPGALLNRIPFSARSQYYEASVLFAPADYSGNYVSAKVKLVAGGAPERTCRAHALIYGISGTSETPSTPVTLVTGEWVDVSMRVRPTGFSELGEIGIRVTTYPCL